MSAILAVGTLILWLLPPAVDARRFCISPTLQCHIGISELDGHTSLMVFNDLQLGPPICLVTGINGYPDPNLVDIQRECLGLVYRHLSYRGVNDCWFFSVSLLDFVLLFAIPAVVWLVRHRNLDLKFREQ